MPLLGPDGYKTYRVSAPIETHHRKATCAEVDCPHYLNGWSFHVEAMLALNPAWEHAARTSGRKFTEVSYGEGQTWLLFEAGQPCFAASEHRMRIDRLDTFIIRDGDHRDNPTGRRAVVSPQAFVDDFGEHQDRLAEIERRG